MLVAEANKKYGIELGRPVGESWVVVQNDLISAARKRAEATLTAVYLRAMGATMADALAGQPLADAQAAAAPHEKAIAEATEALATAQKGHKARLLKIVEAFRADGTDTLPTGEDPAVVQARTALADARENAREALYQVKQLEEKIGLMRAMPGPEAGDLAILAAALGCQCGGPK